MTTPQTDESSIFGSVPVCVPPISDAPDPLQIALRKWLAWNEAYERLTSKMFHADGDRLTLESLAEQVDQLRQQAVEASRTVVD